MINLISGIKSELVPWLASHMDVNAIDTTGVAPEAIAAVQKTAAENVKRVVHFDGDGIGWSDGRRSQGPYAIFDFQEVEDRLASDGDVTSRLALVREVRVVECPARSVIPCPRRNRRARPETRPAEISVSPARLAAVPTPKAAKAKPAVSS